MSTRLRARGSGRSTKLPLADARERERQHERRPWRPETLERQERFLAAYPETGLVMYAAQIAGIDRGSHYDWLDQPKRQPSYEKRFRRLEAKARAAEEAEGRRIWAEFVARPWPTDADSLPLGEHELTALAVDR